MPASRTGRRFDPRRALAIYISGRSRVRHEEAEIATSGGAVVDALWSGSPGDHEPTDPADRPSIVVPETLDYGRSAGTWRVRSSS